MKVVRLGDVCTKIGSGATPRGGQDVYLDRGDVALIRSQNVYNNVFIPDGLVYISPEHATQLASVEVETDDVLLNITGDSVARCCQVDPDILPARVNQHVAIIRPKRTELNPRFLRYVLVSPRMQAQMLTLAHAGATRKALTKGMIESFDIPHPDIDVQDAIAGVLGSLDDKIEQNRRTARALERLARAIFRAWFVDFEPAKAKAEGATSFPSMSQEVFDALPTRFVDSDIGPVPEGWEPSSVYEIAEVIYGAPFSSKRFNDEREGMPLIRIRDLQAHDPAIFTTELHRKGTLIRAGDIVVGMDGEFRLHYWVGPEAWLNQRVCSFKPRTACPRMFVGESLRKPLAYFERAKTGTTVIHLGKQDIDTFRLVHPPADALEAFGDLTEPLLDLIVHAARESRKLAEMRDYLLPKLLTGDVRVEAANG